MVRIAHLTDLHLLEERHTERQGAGRLRLSVLALALSSPPDAADRRRRAARALAAARRSRADHIVITGDVTEDGADPQFEVLAELLSESRIPPSKITLVPGNHDAYIDDEAWGRALAGPLRAFAETSSEGAVTHVGGASIVAISTAFHQPLPRSAGAMKAAGLDAIARAARIARRRGSALVIAQHHPPRRHALAPVHWIDGLVGHAELTALLEEHDHAHVLHGHTHAAYDRAVRPGASPRMFCAESVVEGESPLRVYEAQLGRLYPAEEQAPLSAPALSMFAGLG